MRNENRSCGKLPVINRGEGSPYPLINRSRINKKIINDPAINRFFLLLFAEYPALYQYPNPYPINMAAVQGNIAYSASMMWVDDIGIADPNARKNIFHIAEDTPDVGAAT